MNQLMLMIKLYVKLTQIKMFQHKNRNDHGILNKNILTKWVKHALKIFKWINFCGKSTICLCVRSVFDWNKITTYKAVLSGWFRQGEIMLVQKHLEHGSFDQPQYLFGNFFSCLLFCLSDFFLRRSLSAYVEHCAFFFQASILPYFWSSNIRKKILLSAKQNSHHTQNLCGSKWISINRNMY